MPVQRVSNENTAVLLEWLNALERPYVDDRSYVIKVIHRHLTADPSSPIVLDDDLLAILGVYAPLRRDKPDPEISLKAPETHVATIISPLTARIEKPPHWKQGTRLRNGLGHIATIRSLDPFILVRREGRFTDVYLREDWRMWRDLRGQIPKDDIKEYLDALFGK